MNCPKCVGRLEERKVGQNDSITIDRCFACGGLWFDKNELFRVIKKNIVDTVESELESEKISDEELLIELDLNKAEIICPRCQGNKKMVKMQSPRNNRVTIDYCESCQGIWLDAGEYNAMSKRGPIEDKSERIIDFFRLHFPHIFKENR